MDLVSSSGQYQKMSSFGMEQELSALHLFSMLLDFFPIPASRQYIIASISHIFHFMKPWKSLIKQLSNINYTNIKTILIAYIINEMGGKKLINSHESFTFMFHITLLSVLYMQKKRQIYNSKWQPQLSTFDSGSYDDLWIDSLIIWRGSSLISECWCETLHNSDKVNGAQPLVK